MTVVHKRRKHGEGDRSRDPKHTESHGNQKQQDLRFFLYPVASNGTDVPATTSAPITLSGSTFELPATKLDGAGDDHFQTLSANLKCAPLRLQRLDEFLRSRQRPIDIVLIQDTLKNFPVKSLANYHRWYHHGEKEPAARNGNSDKQKKKEQEGPLDHIAFLVHKSIPSTLWTVERGPGCLAEMLATLKVRTKLGDLYLHNVYNHRNRMDAIINGLLDATTSPTALTMGGFNLHGPNWETHSTAKFKPAGKRLSDGMEEKGMTCKTPRGLPAFTRSETTKAFTPDLTFAGSTIAPFCEDSKVIPVPGFESDHRVVGVKLFLPPKRKPVRRRAWKRVDKVKFRKGIQELCNSFATASFGNEGAIDDSITQLQRGIVAVIEDYVPWSRPLRQFRQSIYASYVRCSLDMQARVAKAGLGHSSAA